MTQMQTKYPDQPKYLFKDLPPGTVFDTPERRGLIKINIDLNDRICTECVYYNTFCTQSYSAVRINDEEIVVAYYPHAVLHFGHKGQ